MVRHSETYRKQKDYHITMKLKYGLKARQADERNNRYIPCENLQPNKKICVPHIVTGDDMRLKGISEDFERLNKILEW